MVVAGDAIAAIDILGGHLAGKRVVFRGLEGRVAGKCGGFIHIGQVDIYGNGALAAVPIGCFHTHNIAVLVLIVVGFISGGPKLTAACVDGEGICVLSFEAIGQGGVLRVGRCYWIADVLDTCRVFGKAACGT